MMWVIADADIGLKGDLPLIYTTWQESACQLQRQLETVATVGDSLDELASCRPVKGTSWLASGGGVATNAGPRASPLHAKRMMMFLQSRETSKVQPGSQPLKVGSLLGDRIFQGTQGECRGSATCSQAGCMQSA